MISTIKKPTKTELIKNIQNLKSPNIEVFEVFDQTNKNTLFKNIKIIVLSQPKNDSFKKFLELLDIYKDKRVELYDRLVFFNIIKQFKEGDVIVCYEIKSIKRTLELN